MQGHFESYDGLREGTIVFGRLRIEGYLGKGATSTVYAASPLNKPAQAIALKVLHSRAAEDPALVALFRNELKVLRSIGHPNIISAYEYYKTGSNEGFTMEYADGGTLHQYIEHCPEISLKRALVLLNQIAEGLEALHEAGIVHRDLKPENILICRGTAKIADFSTALSEEVNLPYEVGHVGTLEYMSPEVLAKGVADKRSDIFALGVIAYQLITGRLPYESTKFADRIELNRRGTPAPLHQINPECSRALSRAIMRALRTNPARRPQSVDEMMDSIAHATVKLGFLY